MLNHGNRDLLNTARPGRLPLYLTVREGQPYELVHDSALGM